MQNPSLRSNDPNVGDRNPNYRYAGASTWFRWVIANAAGCAVGLFVADVFGAEISVTNGASAGRLVATLSFEATLWIARWLALQGVHVTRAWAAIDALVWITGELGIDWFIGEVFATGIGNTPLTEGPVWGAFMGALLWTLYWLVFRQKIAGFGGKAKAFVTAFAVMVGFPLIMSIPLVLVDELARVVGWAIAGAAMGILVGAVTGLTFIVRNGEGVSFRASEC